MAETRIDLLKKIESIVHKLKKLGWDEVCRVNEFNVHTYKLYELRGFISFYERELENEISKWKRNKYWNTPEGKVIKDELETQLKNVSDEYDKKMENYIKEITNMISPFFQENWKYSIYKDKISFIYDEDVYRFVIYFRKSYGKQQKLNVSLTDFRDFNLVNESSKMPVVLNNIDTFLQNIDKTKLLDIYVEWNTEYKKFDKKYKDISYKLFNPDF